MYRALIFDFDGTIADTISAIAEGVNLAMRELGFPEHSTAEVKTFINHGPRAIIEAALPAEKRDPETVSHALDVYNRCYASVAAHTDRAYPGVAELIAGLHENGWKIGVLSNKQDALVRTLTANVLPAGCADAIAGSLPGKPTKPDPYLTLRVAEALGVRPAECILIGDSDVDILTAKNAGMKHVGVAWGYKTAAFLNSAGAEEIASDAAGLKTIIERICNHDQN